MAARLRLIGVLALCALGGVVRAAQDPIVTPNVVSPAALRQQVAAMQQECKASVQAATLADLRRREEQSQRTWCDTTRAARRKEFAAAFVESVRRTKHGGNGLASRVADFLQEHPEAIKPALANTAVCADEKLQVDDALMAPVVNHPSIAGALFGVSLRGTRVSRLNPVSRWEQLVRGGLVVRSEQMQYSTPRPTATPSERTRAIQTAQVERCPSPSDVERILETRTTSGREPTADAALTEADAQEFATVMFSDDRLRGRLGPLMQRASFPSLADACDRKLRALLTYDEVARRMAAQLRDRVDAPALHQMMTLMRRGTDVRWFSTNGTLRLFQPENDEQQATIADLYGVTGRAAWLVDAASITVAANQAFALALADWSSAQTAVTTQSCSN